MISAQFSYIKKGAFRKDALTKTKKSLWIMVGRGRLRSWTILNFLSKSPSYHQYQSTLPNAFWCPSAPSCWISLIAPRILFTSFPLRILSSFSWRAEGEAVQGLTKIWLQIMHLIIIQDRRKLPMSFKSGIFTFSACSVVIFFRLNEGFTRFHFRILLATSSAPPPRE